MVILIRMVTRVESNPKGVAYAFPHYSTCLGAILATYHRYKKSPLPTKEYIDPFLLAKTLGVSISLLTRTDNDNVQNVDYRLSNTVEVQKKKLQSVPTNVFSCTGEFFILIKTDNEDVINSLCEENNSIRMGNTNSMVYDRSIQDFDSLEGFYENYSEKLMFLKQKDNTSPSFQLIPSEETTIVNLTSKIKIENYEILLSGLSQEVEWEILDKDLENLKLVDYKDIYEKNEDVIKKEVDRINRQIYTLVNTNEGD